VAPVADPGSAAPLAGNPDHDGRAPAASDTLQEILMAVLIALFGGWALFRALGLGLIAFDTWHHSLPYALALMFVFTGVARFNKTKYELAAMVPGFFHVRASSLPSAS